MIAGIALYFILKVLGIIFGICCFVWCFFKLVGADKEADDVEDFGGKIVDIFGVIIRDIIKYKLNKLITLQKINDG